MRVIRSRLKLVAFCGDLARPSLDGDVVSIFRRPHGNKQIIALLDSICNLVQNERVCCVKNGDMDIFWKLIHYSSDIARAMKHFVVILAYRSI